MTEAVCANDNSIKTKEDTPTEVKDASLTKVEKDTKPTTKTTLAGPIPLYLGGTFPNIKCETSNDPLFDLYKYKDQKWLVFFSHPKDFTPVCTTEFARAVSLYEQFEKRGVKLLGLSPDPVDSHIKWGTDILDYANKDLGCTLDSMPFPIIADADRTLAREMNLLSEEDFQKDGIPESCRACFYVSPDNKLKAQMYYPPSVGRDFSEILRVVDALLIGTKNKLAAPEGWKNGMDMMLTPAWTKEKAEDNFGKDNLTTVEVPSQKEYMTYVKVQEN